MKNNENEKQYIYSSDEINLYEQWLKIKKRKKLILSITLGSIIIAIIVTFLLTPIYKSTATVIPIYESDKSKSSFINLAAMTGLGIGQSNEFKKIMAVLQSRTVKERVIKKLKLIDILLEEKPEERNPLYVALEKFKKNINIIIDAKTDTIQISYYDKDPKLAAKVVKSYVEEAQNILRDKALTVAKLNRIFLEKQLKDIESRIKQLKEELATYQKKHDVIQPDLQLNNATRIYTDLLEKKMEAELELKRLQATLSPTNPKIHILKKEIKELDNRLKKIKLETKEFPEKLVKYKELVSNLTALKEVYQTVMQMYEQAKLDEAKSILYIQVIDEPEIPDKPDKPNKKLIVSFTGIFAFVASLILAFILEARERRKKLAENL